MTLEEKVTQLVNQARAIPRLNVPAYDWWSESLHGVAADGTTEFPEPDRPGRHLRHAAIHRMAEAIGTEGRASSTRRRARRAQRHLRGPRLLGAEHQHLSRSPLGTRPGDLRRRSLPDRRAWAWLCHRHAGRRSRYYRVISTPKHFAVHSGPEPTRHTADVPVSKHDELDTYLPAFRAAVTEGKAGSVMCAYNSINGQPACANEFLLQDQLRGKWGFRAMWFPIAARSSTSSRPSLHQDPARGLGISLQRGMDNECIDFRRQGQRRSRLQAVSRCRQAGLPERERDRHGADAPVHGAHEAGHVRSAGDGALFQDRRKAAGQRASIARWRASWPMSPWCC
jgi:beta-glucosidase